MVNTRVTSNFNAFEVYKSIARDKENLNGHIEYLFTDRFARLFDDAVLSNNKDIFSPEQLKLVNLYFKEADGEMSDKVKQLDKFLGGL